MSHLSTPVLLLAASLFPIHCAQAQAQLTRPDTSSQKEAMRKLEFLAGTWEGESMVTQGRDQTGKTVYSALGIVSFDQKANRYVIRAWNSGNFVETEMKVASNGSEWGFQSGPLTMISRMTIDEKGRWSENLRRGSGRRPQSSQCRTAADAKVK